MPLSIATSPARPSCSRAGSTRRACTIARATSEFTAASLVERVPLRDTTTLSDRLGASPEWVMVIAGLAALAVALVARRRAHTVGDRRTGANEEENA